MKKTLKQLKKELANSKEYHRSICDTYGSELCTGEMLAKEKKLEDEILKLEKQNISKDDYYIEDPSQIVDD